MEDDFQEKMDGMKARMNQAVELESKTVKRNIFLEEIYNQDQKDKNQLQAKIKLLE